jgi:hypothetical protein
MDPPFGRHQEIRPLSNPYLTGFEPKNMGIRHSTHTFVGFYNNIKIAR